jgi:hypothetical protein
VSGSSRSERPAANTTPNRNRPGDGGMGRAPPARRGSVTDGSAGSSGTSAMGRPALWHEGELRGNSARIAGDAPPGKKGPKRATSHGRRASPARPRSLPGSGADCPLPQKRSRPATPGSQRWLAPTGQRSSAGLSPAQALRLGMLLRRELPSPVGVLPSLLSQRPTLISEVLMHSRDVLLDLGDRLSHPGDPRPERLALRPCVLGSLERSRAAGVRIGHDGDRVPLRPAALPVTGQPDARRTWHGRDDRPCYIGRPIRSLVAKTRARTGVRVRQGPEPTWAALGPHTTGRPRTRAGSDGQPTAQVNGRFRTFAEVAESP